MRSVFALLLLASTAFAQPDYHVSSGFGGGFVPPPAPATAIWRLANADGAFVEATFSNITMSLLTKAYDFPVNPQWSAAVNDPAFNISTMTFGNTTKQASFVHERYGSLELERIRILVAHYLPSQVSDVAITGIVSDFGVVPEPSSFWFMLCMSVALLSARNTARR